MIRQDAENVRNIPANAVYHTTTATTTTSPCIMMNTYSIVTCIMNPFKGKLWALFCQAKLWSGACSFGPEDTVRAPRSSVRTLCSGIICIIVSLHCLSASRTIKCQRWIRSPLGYLYLETRTVCQNINKYTSRKPNNVNQKTRPKSIFKDVNPIVA